MRKPNCRLGLKVKTFKNGSKVHCFTSDWEIRQDNILQDAKLWGINNKSHRNLEKLSSWRGKAEPDYSETSKPLWGAWKLFKNNREPFTTVNFKKEQLHRVVLTGTFVSRRPSTTSSIIHQSVFHGTTNYVNSDCFSTWLFQNGLHDAGIWYFI